MARENVAREDHRHFVSGLRTVIRRSWPTQEQFAEGVTSKVNLSNILNDKAGTSLKLRKAIANKAGMSVEDIINIGKGIIKTRSTDRVPSIAVPKLEPPVTLSLTNLAEMDSGTLYSEAADYAADTIDKALAWAKDIGQTVKTLADERNRLLHQLQQEQLVLNSIHEAVKVVDRNMQIIYCNTTYTEMYSNGEGDHCNDGTCDMDTGDCLAEKVFSSGKAERVLTEKDGVWLYKRAHPVPSLTGKTHCVVVVCCELTGLVDLMENAGWERKAECNVELIEN